jgi:hypothetical protein
LTIFEAKRQAVTYLFGSGGSRAFAYESIGSSAAAAVNGVGIESSSKLAVFFRRRVPDQKAILRAVAEGTGYGTRAVVTGEFSAVPPLGHGSQDRQGYVRRPVPCGVSVGHYQTTTGTLGCLVRHSNGRDYILSNNHVLANSNSAGQGDPIYQPGPYDGGGSSSTIASLSSWAPLVGGTNFVDAALAEPHAGSVRPEILDIGPLRGVGDPVLDSPVRKSGRTTGLTEGILRFTGAYLQVNYGILGNLGFDDQMVIESASASAPFSSGGDSGSIIVDDAGSAVGLLFAGSDTFTLANPIQEVFDLLRLTHVIAPSA